MLMKSLKLKINSAKNTPFQKKVWSELLRIPRGETRTYGQIAGKIGHPRASRAVGYACKMNPFPVIVPCHRVIRSDGRLGGYSGRGGPKRKAALLKQEKPEKAENIL